MERLAGVRSVEIRPLFEFVLEVSVRHVFEANVRRVPPVERQRLCDGDAVRLHDRRGLLPLLSGVLFSARYRVRQQRPTLRCERSPIDRPHGFPGRLCRDDTAGHVERVRLSGRDRTGSNRRVRRPSRAAARSPRRGNGRSIIARREDRRPGRNLVRRFRTVGAVVDTDELCGLHRYLSERRWVRQRRRRVGLVRLPVEGHVITDIFRVGLWPASAEDARDWSPRIRRLTDGYRVP